MCERPDVYDESIIKTRKPHKCYECSRTININDEYTKIKGLWNSKWSNFNYCNSCTQLRKYLENDVGIDCLGIGEIYKELRNCSTIVFDEETQAWESGDDNIIIESQEPLLVKLGGQ
jgi:hypothetical protein